MSIYKVLRVQEFLVEADGPLNALRDIPLHINEHLKSPSGYFAYSEELISLAGASLDITPKINEVEPMTEAEVLSWQIDREVFGLNTYCDDDPRKLEIQTKIDQLKSQLGLIQNSQDSG